MTKVSSPKSRYSNDLFEIVGPSLGCLSSSPIDFPDVNFPAQPKQFGVRSVVYRPASSKSTYYIDSAEATRDRPISTCSRISTPLSGDVSAFGHYRSFTDASTAHVQIVDATYGLAAGPPGGDDIIATALLSWLIEPLFTVELNTGSVPLAVSESELTDLMPIVQRVNQLASSPDGPISFEMSSQALSLLQLFYREAHAMTAQAWRSPTINIEDDALTLDWWLRGRSLALAIRRGGEIDYFKMWPTGGHDRGYEEGSAATSEERTRLWKWLLGN